MMKSKPKPRPMPQPIHVDPAAPLLGEVVAFDVHCYTMPYEDVKAALNAAGLPDCVKGLRPQTAFTRATKALRENRTIDRLQRDGSIFAFQFTRKYMESARLQFDFETIVYLDTETGLITCPDDDRLEEHARALFDFEMGHRGTSDITKIVKDLFSSHADLYPLIPSKGVAYFVPAPFRDFVEKIEAFLNGLGGTLARFPVPRGDVVAQANVADAIETGLAALATELDGVIDAWDGHTRALTIEKAVDRWTVARHKVESYAEYLGTKKDSLLDKLTDTKRRIASKVAELDPKPAQSAGAHVTPTEGQRELTLTF